MHLVLAACLALLMAACDTDLIVHPGGLAPPEMSGGESPGLGGGGVQCSILSGTHEPDTREACHCRGPGCRWVNEACRCGCASTPNLECLICNQLQLPRCLPTGDWICPADPCTASVAGPPDLEVFVYNEETQPRLQDAGGGFPPIGDASMQFDSGAVSDGGVQLRDTSPSDAGMQFGDTSPADIGLGIDAGIALDTGEEDGGDGGDVGPVDVLLGPPDA